MDDDRARRFFLEPTQTLARHYEILRGYFVERRSLTDLADAFALNYYTVRDLVRRFRDQCQHGQVPPFLLSPALDAPPGSKPNTLVRTCLLLPIAASCSSVPAVACGLVSLAFSSLCRC